MPVQISLQKVSKAYSAHPLFHDLSLAVESGDRLGIIGPNGSGKSTLLTILAGSISPDEGERMCARGIKVVHVLQQENFPADATCRSVIQSTLNHLPSHERDAQASIVLGRGLFADPEVKVSTLSGGWRKRLALCVMLAQDPEVMLLDEPTNHLDLAGVRWLEDILRRSTATVVLVSHDRWFLDRVATSVVEIDRRHPDGCFRAPGGYAEFIEARETFLAGQRARQESLANQVKREEEWLRRQPKARTVKSASRVQRAGDLRQELDNVSWRNTQNQRAAIDFTATGRRANALISCEGLQVDRGGRTLVNGFDCDLGPGERLGLLGPNGSGKSTLMQVMGGLLPPADGKLRLLGGLRVVRFEQDRGRLDPRQTLRRTLCPNGDTIAFRDRSVHVVGWAKRFLFRPEQLDLTVGELSGGEQARLLISLLVREPADVLLLDEPTNDLDIPALEVLEDALLDFPGAVVLVTHDRWLLARVCDRLLALDGAGSQSFVPDYPAWEAAQHERAPSPKTRGGQNDRNRSAPSLLTTKEKRELERMEAAIETAETAATAVEEELADPKVQHDAELLQSACERLAEANTVIEKLYSRWQELEAKAAGKHS